MSGRDIPAAGHGTSRWAEATREQQDAACRHVLLRYEEGKASAHEAHEALEMLGLTPTDPPDDRDEWGRRRWGRRKT